MRGLKQKSCDRGTRLLSTGCNPGPAVSVFQIAAQESPELNRINGVDKDRNRGGPSKREAKKR